MTIPTGKLKPAEPRFTTLSPAPERPEDWPAETFDLILLSEVVYYLDGSDVARLARRVEKSLSRGGDLVLGAGDFILAAGYLGDGTF